MKLSTLLTTSLLLTAPLLHADAPCVCTVEQMSKAFTQVAKQATPAVVFIRVEINPSENDPFSNNNPYGSFGDDFFRRFFGTPYGRPQTPQPQIGQGSGFLVTADGFILTNAHVVKGADKIEVTINDGQVQTATLIGVDPQTDLAVIKIDKIEGKDYPFLVLGNSETLEVGEWVIAIGNPFQLQASLTVGVVSAKGRQGLNITDMEDFIQTDAAINPGNSGGPLLDLNGQVIGINTAIATRSGGYMGIGFAIPSDMAKGIMDQLISKGSVTRGFLGIGLQPVDKDIADAFNLEKAEGVLISAVEKGSPADKAGLRQGDIILECNGKPIKSLQTFRYDISMINPGTQVALKINRKGKIMTINVTLGSFAENGSPADVNQKLGIEVEPMNADLARQLGYSLSEEGLVIMKVKPGSLAAAAGLRPGYVIQAVNHKKVSTMEDYEEALKDAAQNKRVLFLVRQGKATKFYSIRVE